MDDEAGTLPGTGFDRRSARAGVEARIRDGPRICGAIGAARTTTDLPAGGMDGWLGSALLGDPALVGFPQDGWDRAEREIRSIETTQSAERLLPSVEIEHHPAGWLSHRLLAGADLSRVEAWQRKSVALSNGRSGVERTDGSRRVDRYTLRYQASVRLPLLLQDRMRPDLALGLDSVDGEARNEYYHACCPGEDSSGGAWPITEEWTRRTLDRRTAGHRVRGQLAYRERLLAHAGVRLDRHTFPVDRTESIVAPSVGASYLVSNEAFWRPLAPVLGTLRLRAAWGRTTRDPASFPRTLSMILIPAPPGGTELEPLSPETVEELEFGLDAGLFSDRITLAITRFDQKGEDLLARMASSPSVGFGEEIRNGADIRNRGIEAWLEARLLARHNLAWDARLGLSALHSELLASRNPTVRLPSPQRNRFVPGHQPGAFFARRILEVDTVAGRVIVTDTSEFAGNLLPSREGYLWISLALGSRARVSGLLDWRGGFTVFDWTTYSRERYALAGYAGADLDGRTTGERLRRTGPYFRADGTRVGGLQPAEGVYIRDGSFIRVRELSLTLALPDAWAARVRARGAPEIAGASLAVPLAPAPAARLGLALGGRGAAPGVPCRGHRAAPRRCSGARRLG